MAKVKSTKTRSEGASSLIKKLKKSSTIEDTCLFSESDFYTVIEQVPTPFPLINLALSGKVFTGGISRGVTILAGESRSGKTIFMLLCLKAYLDFHEDSIGLLWDSEFSLTPDYLKSFDIDTDRVLVSRVADLDTFKIDIVTQLNNIEKGDHVFLGCDSLGGLASTKETKDALESKVIADVGNRSKTSKSIMRIIVPLVNMKEVPFFGITHSYNTIEIYSKQIVSGGTSLMYAANTVLLFSRRKNQNKDEAGYEFVIKIEKSRFCKDTIKLPLVAPENGRFKKWSSMYDLAVEHKFIKSGAWVEIPCLSEYEDKKVRRKDIEDSDEFWNKIFTLTDFKDVLEKYVAVGQDQSGVFNDIEEEVEELLGNAPEDSYTEENKETYAD